MAQTNSDMSAKLDTAIKADNVDQIRRLTKTCDKSALRLACRHNAVKTVEYFLSCGGEITDDCMKALSDGDSWETHRFLVENKAVDVNRHVPWIGDMLGSAIQEGNAEHVKFLLDHGADPHLHRYDDAWTNLAGAADVGRVDIVEMLLAYEWKNSGALVAAADAGHLDVVELLLSKGFDVNEVGIFVAGHDLSLPRVGTALHKAVQKNHTDIVPVLVAAGADRTIKDGKGRTVDELAQEVGNADVLNR